MNESARSAAPPVGAAPASPGAGTGYWWRSVGGPPLLRAPLDGSRSADIAIVGAGYTGLWSAYYIKRASPGLRVVVLEREHAGYGASGRNGGWVTGFFSGPARVYERHAGRAGRLALQREMFAAVDEVGTFLARHGIDADFRKSGQLTVALGSAQAQRLSRAVRSAHAGGLEVSDLRELGPRELASRLRVAGACAGAYTPHVARVHPVRLLAGLTEAVERLGVEIYERTPVVEIRPGRALTSAGELRARWIVRATEGYTPDLRGLRRALVPLNSSMLITEPLPPAAWEQIGWSGEELLSDAAHAYVYLQRTPEGRIAIGGRGVPYRFGSATGGATTPGATVAALKARLLELFPAASGAEVEQAWSGVLGLPRNWAPAVQVDAASGLAAADGYVGQGLAASNLAGRTLRDLLLGDPTPLTFLPWVANRRRRWEPEPLRWCAIRGMYALYRRADRVERRSGRPSRLAGALDRLAGRA